MIESELESGKNFIVMNGNKIVAAYSLNGLNVDYPYNLCFDTKSSRTVRIEMEGLGRDGVNVIPYCEQLDCTTVPEELQPNEKEKLVYIVCGADQDCIQKCGEDVKS